MKKEKNVSLQPFKNTGKRIHKDASGLKFIVEKAGSGQSPTTGCRVSVLYRMYLTTGKLVDSSWKRRQPFIFRVGSGSVIKGFETAVTLLKKGGRTISFIPSKLGYGKRGSPPLIPKNSDLICDAELISFGCSIEPATVVMGNPCIAIATIEKILCCVGDQLFYLKGDSAKIIRELFLHPVKLSELSRQLSKDSDFNFKQLARFMDDLIDKGVVVIQRAS